MHHRNEQEIMKNWQVDGDKPVVSICCTTYNHEAYIAEAIDGFLMQETDFPFEILIRDDCSTDKTADIVKQYADQYPQIIKPVFETENQYSKGVRPMPVLFKKSMAKYIAMCEGDDYWIDPLKLQKQVIFLEANPDYGLVCTDMTKYIQIEGKYVESGILPLNEGGWVYEELINWSNQVWTLTACFRKICLVDIPDLDSSKYFTGDRLLFLHFSQKFKFKYFSEKTAVYRVLQESASHFKSEIKSIEFTYKVANLMLYYLENYPVDPKVHRIVFYQNMLARFKFSRATGAFDIFKTVQLELPSSPSIKMRLLYLLFILCQWKPFFLVFSFFYKKQIDSFK